MPPDPPGDPPVRHIRVHDEVVLIESVAKLAAASHFSDRWFADAREQSRLPGQDARRREILFAVCVAETYLFEWVLHEVFRDDWDGATKFFPESARRGVHEKWQEVPKELVADHRLPATPDLGGPHGSDWLKLVGLRDALMHAAVSRPRVRMGDDPAPMTTSSGELEALAPGWALGVVVDRIHRLHSAAVTPPPSWLAK